MLVVSQFTLAADTERGMRPGFQGAAPDVRKTVYEYFVERCRQQEMNTQTGRFAADMVVSLVNDGPVTFLAPCMNQLPVGRGQQERIRLCITFEYRKQKKSWNVTTSFAGRCCVNLLHQPKGSGTGCLGRDGITRWWWTKESGR